MKKKNTNPVNDWLTPEDKQILEEMGIEIVIDDLPVNEPIRLTAPIVKAESQAFSVDGNNRFVFNPTPAFAGKLLKIFKTHNPAITKADLEGIVNRMFDNVIKNAGERDISDPATLTMAARVLQKLLTEKKRQEKYINSFYKELGF